MALVVVTGSSGLVGAAVASAVSAAGWEVRGVDRVPGTWTSLLGDLRESSVRRAAVRGADGLVHSAALHAPHVGLRPDSDFWVTNVEVTRLLLADAVAAGASRVVYVSSTSVYGHALVPESRAVWVDEALVPRPRDVYDETKLAAERLVAASRLPAVTLRIARCFPEPLPELVVHRLHRGVDVTDVAAATVLALQHESVRGTFTISGPHPFDRADCRTLFRDAEALIAERAPRVARFFATRGWNLPSRLDRVYDSRAAVDVLGYRPVVGAEDLLPAA